MQIRLTCSPLLFALLLFSPSLFGQTTTPDSANVYFIGISDSVINQKEARNFTWEIKTRAKAVSKKINELSYENRDLIRYGLVPISLTTAWYGTYKGIDADLQDETQEAQHPVTNSVASRIEPFGRSKYWLPAFGGMMAYGVIAKNPKARKTAAIGISTLLVNNLVTGNLKAYFNRHRPNSGSDFNTWDGPEGATGRNHSFPSSHTSTAFAAATVFATAYKDKKWVPIVAYSGATMVGFSRIYQDHHWASDVLAGAVVGVITAKGTYWAYEFIERKLKIKKSVVLIPQAGPSGVGLSVSMGF